MRVHPPEFRAAVVAEYVAGKTCNELAAAHGIGASTVSNWVKAAGYQLRPAAPRARVPVPKWCAVDGCDRPHAARGYCHLHYKREVARAEVPRRNPALHLEDVEWMASTGEELSRAARRIGVAERTLIRHLERANRYDLIRKLRGRAVA